MRASVDTHLSSQSSIGMEISFDISNIAPIKTYNVAAKHASHAYLANQA